LNRESAPVAQNPSTPAPITGMVLYNNNGIQFQYPEKLLAKFASLSVNVTVEKADPTKLDSNGCYPNDNDSTYNDAPSPVFINGIKFCYSHGGDAAMGSSYYEYDYRTFRNGNSYLIHYQVQQSNCGAYMNSEDLSSPDNKTYNQCVAEQKNFDTLVSKPIKDSIATFKFIN
jgi:hypothetical protein